MFLSEDVSSGGLGSGFKMSMRSRDPLKIKRQKYCLALEDSLQRVLEQLREMPEVERVVEADIAARGAQATAPVGAGGAADSRLRAGTGVPAP